MKKKVLALSIAAMIGGVAHAGVSFPGVATVTTADTLAVTPDGIGHILLVPYFSTNNGNTTLLSIVNTDVVFGKAVKVRFRGAANSDDIFDFQVYMSPGDVWTAAVTQAADGRSQLTTTDRSCTLPFNINQPFITDRLLPSASAADKAAQTREGYVEIFNMADIRDDGAVTTDLFSRVKHVAGVAPCLQTAPAALLTALSTNPADIAAAEGGSLQFRAPTTGLTGSWTILNIAGASVAWSDNMTAIRANVAATGLAGTGRIVFSPQNNQSAGAAAVYNTLTSDPLIRTTVTSGATAPLIAGLNFDLPDLSTPYTGVGAIDENSPIAQANQLSTALAVRTVINEYLTDTTITANTDWTFSMPTRRYGVAFNYNSAAADKRAFTTGNLFFNGGNTTTVGNLICVIQPSIGATGLFDREETTPGATFDFVISPGTGTPALRLCGEVSVLTFNGSNVLGATIATQNIAGPYRDGWATIPTPGILNGLPILGSSFVRATGPAVAGRSTNFSTTNLHRYTR